MKRYNKIVGTFTKTIQKLEALHSTCLSKVDEIVGKIGSLEATKAAEIQEANLAKNTADKLKEIFPEL
jgi:hypothetical protein